MSLPVALPPLETLASRPSWVNRTGRVDRSACIELRASDVWRDCTNMKPVRTTHGPVAVGTITMHTRWMLTLHNKRLPFALQGDFRTAKSNAMKDPELAGDAMDIRQHWPHNPNRGAARKKMLGLWDGSEYAYEKLGPWRQSIRIERWQRPRKSARKNARKQKSRLPNADCRLPSPVPPTHRHFLICPRCEKKVAKLFMILCTEREVLDAELAERWIEHCDARLRAARATPSREYMQMCARLIDRYGLLFRARRLACRACLNIRYGQVRDDERRADPYFREKVRRVDARPYHSNQPR